MYLKRSSYKWQVNWPLLILTDALVVVSRRSKRLQSRTCETNATLNFCYNYFLGGGGGGGGGVKYSFLYFHCYIRRFHSHNASLYGRDSLVYSKGRNPKITFFFTSCFFTLLWLGNWKSTARKIGYRLEQLLCFLHALSTSHVHV